MAKPLSHAPAASPANRLGMLSVRMMESTLEALARRAIKLGKSQRHVVASALAAMGIEVDPADINGRPPPGRRGRPNPAVAATSPKPASPKRVAPKRVTPAKVSPQRTAPKRSKPKKTV